MENGSWNPKANKIMKSMLTVCKDISFFTNSVTINASLNENNMSQINDLALEIAGNKKTFSFPNENYLSTQTWRRTPSQRTSKL